MNRKGLSLLETVVVLAIFSGTLFLILGVWHNSLNYWNKINNYIELQQNLRLAMEEIISDLEKVKEIEQLGRDFIIVRDLDNNRIKYELGPDPYTNEHLYQLKGKTLYRTLNISNKQPIANFITELVFEAKGNGGSGNYINIKIGGELPQGKKASIETGVQVKWKAYY